nr:family 43 glycosylhydrolase [Bacteroidaceae bacterium]
TEKGMYLYRDLQGGQMSRDMTVFIDDDGKAYHITSSQENLTLLVNELTDDYLDFTGKYNMIAPGGQNEAPTILKHDGKYWLICSGCTGWAPNKARMFVSEKIWGPWKQCDSPFMGDNASYRNFPADKTFGGQGTYILNMKEMDLSGKFASDYYFMADIWNPGHLSQSLHIWLPIKFNSEGVPYIKWVDNPFDK